MSGTCCSARLRSAADLALKLSEQVVVDLPVAGFFSNGNPFRRKKVRVAEIFFSLSLDQMTTKEMAKFSKNKCLSYFFSAAPAIINTWNYQPFENTLKTEPFKTTLKFFFGKTEPPKFPIFLSKVVDFTPLLILLLTFDSNFSQSGDFLSNNCR